MINLLPPEIKSSISFARRNAVLKNWVIASIIALLGIVLILAAGNLLIKRFAISSEKQVADVQTQLKAQKLEETQARVTEISESVKLATQVLSKQVLFSKLLTQVGSAIPVGSSLQSLNINSIEGGIDLTAVATNYQTATQVQINLSDPANKIFDKSDIVSITCSDSGAEDYPCTVIIRALFAKDNAFQYTTNKGGN